MKLKGYFLLKLFKNQSNIDPAYTVSPTRWGDLHTGEQALYTIWSHDQRIDHVLWKSLHFHRANRRRVYF